MTNMKAAKGRLPSAPLRKTPRVLGRARDLPPRQKVREPYAARCHLLGSASSARESTAVSAAPALAAKQEELDELIQLIYAQWTEAECQAQGESLASMRAHLEAEVTEGTLKLYKTLGQHF